MRLIDADELKKKAYPFPCAIGTENAVTIRAINEAPTVEVIREGRWKGAGMGDYECTCCWEVFSLGHDIDKHFKFCPNCGADMR